MRAAILQVAMLCTSPLRWNMSSRVSSVFPFASGCFVLQLVGSAKQKGIRGQVLVLTSSLSGRCARCMKCVRGVVDFLPGIRVCEP